MRTIYSLLLCAALVVSAVPALGQGVTTGALSGTVVDSEGGALPGVTVDAVHVPTGTRYTVITREDGRYDIRNARVGGPYTVSAQLDGFKTQEVTGVFVRLGQDTPVNFTLQLGAIEETVTVIGQADSLFSAARTGAASTVSVDDIENLPTVGRQLTDFARTNPFIVSSAENEAPEAISVAGRSGRYNNIQIDGAVNNDLFGLSDQGTPGGQANTTPISLDAIQEIELVIADFDVRKGGFSGGSVNAITRSGTNNYTGSVFYFTRDDGLVGDGPDVLGDFGTFDEDQYGFRLGGPLAQDKMFFFVNAEISDSSRPTGWSIDGNGGQQFGNGTLVDAANLFRQTLMDRYGFDPGSLSQDTLDTPSDKYFGRLDFNLSASHNLTLRHNFVDAGNDINNPSNTTFEFPSEAYDFRSKTNSTVLQLNSVLGANAFNEARVSLQTIRDRRAGRGGVRFPWIEIEDVLGSADSDRFEFEVGTEPFSTKNALDQDILEITDDFTWIKGNHTFVVGTHNELFSFDNLFIQNAFGAYQYATLDDFLNDNVRQYDFTIVPPGQAESQKFDVNQFGLYFGDTWAVRDDLSLNFGLRVDVPFFPDNPSRNPFTEATYGFRTDEMPDGKQLWQPRLGFNWDIGGQATKQLRGGVGIFAGRAPYVWISNNYARTGIEQQFVTIRGGVPFNPDPDGQTIPAGVPVAIGEFNLIDPDFEFPQVLRYNLAYDHKLPWWNLVGSVEAIYADSIQEIDYQNVNIRQTGTLPFDGRPTFETVDPGVSGAFLITNSSEGNQTNIAVKLERRRGAGVYGFVAYTWGDSKVVNEGSSSRAVSNWQFNEAINPNDAGESTSDFEVKHRISAQLGYEFNKSTRFPTAVNLFYNLQSGRPYTTLLGTSRSIRTGSFNGDGFFFSNDLFYVPSGPDDVVIASGGTYADLDAYISADDCLSTHRGQIAPRNCSSSPWNHTLDLHLSQQIPVGFGHLELTGDLLNLVNLFDKNSGNVRYVPFGTITIADYAGIQDGKPVYELRTTDPDDRFVTNNITSRWRAKLGIRYTF
ncbi:MAG: carboxypeptidase regulatory-like domain-containing protein [Acidobacteria bacterium]|nr:carboxypeptidase regulatory-like domain-containing protein [Acidobacteriota bacterium]